MYLPTMEANRQAALFLTICAIFYGRAAIVFNCNRPGSECPNIEECVNGTCSCQTSGLVYRCDLDLDLYELASIPCAGELACQNGLCLTALSQPHVPPTCQCHIGFYGSSCDLPRYDVICGGGEMTVLFNPFRFSGVVRPLYYLEDDVCILSSITADSRIVSKHPEREGVGKVLPHTASGDQVCINSAEYSLENGYHTYTRHFLVQYSHDIIMDHDELVSMTCKVAETTQRIVKTVVTAHVSHGYLRKSTETGQATHFNMGIFDKMIRPINTSDPQPVGATLRLKIEISERSNFSALIVESCFALGSETSVNSYKASVKFVNNGCPLRPLGIGAQTSADKRLTVISFTVVKFLRSDIFHLVCTVRGCPVNMVDQCLVSSCNSSVRGKREASTAKVETLRQTLRVQDPFADISQMIRILT
ncbi:uncharacterized protein LOC112556394 [Pomacea canaliculata]|uniref:uncharacterized protein LOC112556394 n=1 Tax=Pomacea canaliculata TaxID=400727 RepID=UPI000D73A861|nr:uncharacterized protein LOC112556394 [Pomacea canaliculata]